MAAAWVVLVGLATGFYCAPRGAEVQPTLDDAIGFGCSLGIAGAASVVVAFGLGGRRRWATEFAVAALLASVVLAVLVVYFLWVDPTLARRRMNLWEFRRVQRTARDWVGPLAGYNGPLGAVVGALTGGAVGLLTRLGRCRPRLAAGIGLATLLGCASDWGQSCSFGLLQRLGWMLRFRLVPYSYSDDQISIMAMILGGIAGAVIAGVAMHAARGRGHGFGA